MYSQSRMEIREKEACGKNGPRKGSCERARKHKQHGMVVLLTMGLSKCHKFNIITTDNADDEEETPLPFIAICLGIERLETYAFIDSGVDGNTISYELFQKLKDVKLIEIDAVFEANIGHKMQAFGMCSLDLNVSELICGEKFFVTLPKMQNVPIIMLKRMWQRKYNCFLNWSRTLARCQSAKDNWLWMPLQQSDASYASYIMPIPKQLNSNKTPNQFPETHIKQDNIHIWLKKNNNSTTTND